MDEYKVNPVTGIVPTNKDPAAKPIQRSTKKTTVNKIPFSDALAKAVQDNEEQDNVVEVSETAINTKPDLSKSMTRFYANDDLTCSYPGINSSRVTEGFFSYCFDDADGLCQEFDTLAEAKRAAKQCSAQNPDVEINIYGMSSFYYKNGKQI